MRAQVEEKERLKRMEREKKLQEDLEEERKLQAERDALQSQYEQEQQKIRQKEVGLPTYPTHPDYYSLVIKFIILGLSKFRIFYVRFCWKRLRAYTNDRLCIILTHLAYRANGNKL